MSASFRLVCPTCAGPRPLPARGGTPDDCPRCGHALTVRRGVVVLDALPGAGDYPAQLAPLDFALEQRHWWHASRNAVLARALAPFGPHAGRTLVDLGCGTGWVLAALERLGFEALGLDMSEAALALARGRSAAPLVRTGAASVPLVDPVDVLLLCDVLEHADEQQLLASCHAALKPGGLLVVSVPARAALWSTEDVAVGHRRRYERQALADVLLRHGFALELLRPFHMLVSLLALGRREPAQVPADPVSWLAARRQAPSALASRLFASWFALENRVGARLSLPWGSHLLAIARRPR